MPPVQPMLAKSVKGIPDPAKHGGLMFEPKWDGFRCIVFRDGPDIELTSRKERPFTRYFPELIQPLLAALPERCVVDGEIVVASANGDGLDFDALLQRIHRSGRHVGKTLRHPPRNAALLAELVELRRRLQTAVETEAYEEAARLRDLLRQKEATDESG